MTKLNPSAGIILNPKNSPQIDPRKRLFLKVGAVTFATLGAGLLSACGGGNGVSDPLSGCVPVYDENGKWLTDSCSKGGSGGEPPRTVATVAGSRILLNDSPFIGKGFCYSPAPIGADFKYQPWGDFFTPFWKDVYRRDLPRMREMGVNTIRVYTTSPFFEPWNPNSAPQEHTDFLDACYENGIFVWVTHPIDSGAFHDSTKRNNIQIGVETLARDLKDHPAVIGFVIGNEINNGTDRADPAWWQWIDGLAATAKATAPDKLTMACFVDDSMETIKYANTTGGGAPHLDVFGINSYRGNTQAGFDNLFETYHANTTRPLMITEFGCPASTRDGNGNVIELPNRAQAQSDYLAVHWKDIAAHPDVCAGGYVFEWSDEWWKGPADTASTHEGSDATNAAFPGGWGDEEWFGIHSIAVAGGRDPKNPVNPNNGTYIPDVLTPRAAYDTLAALWL